MIYTKTKEGYELIIEVSNGRTIRLVSDTPFDPQNMGIVRFKKCLLIKDDIVIHHLSNPGEFGSLDDYLIYAAMVVPGPGLIKLGIIDEER